MRIAEIAPLFEAVPPQKYGGSERVVANLSEGLSQKGHQVTIFCAGDSNRDLGAEIVAATPQSLSSIVTDSRDFEFDWASHYDLFQKVADRQDEFDIIHFHTNFFHFPFLHLFHKPAVTTVHFRLDRPELIPLYRRFQAYPFISISNSQRRPLPFANWTQTVYHGLPSEKFPFGNGDGGYAVFLGRLSPVKGPDKAIQIAKQAGLKLKIAAKINEWEMDYFRKEIKPHLEDPDIEYLGTVNEEEKKALLKDASVVLFPIQWPEPFGLVMIEAMACGTPVIAFRAGSVPEVIDEGVTGAIVNSVSEAVATVPKVLALSRQKVRERFEERFSALRMATDYEVAYADVIDHHDSLMHYLRRNAPGRKITAQFNKSEIAPSTKQVGNGLVPRTSTVEKTAL